MQEGRFITIDTPKQIVKQYKGSLFALKTEHLFRLLEISRENPACEYPVIGVPVGFVGAAESKQALTESQLPYIAALGRKGGSNVAAAIVNAILYHLREAQ